MNDSLTRLLTANGVQPTLVDVGASGRPPDVWLPIALCATYVGFDPDLREFSKVTSGTFRTECRIAAVVGPDEAAETAPLYLTRSPFCSSTLAPDPDALAPYLFADLFAVERQVNACATTLGKALTQAGLPPRIDWLKLDTQGTDLRILQSLSEEMAGQVLAVDVEPGLIDAYRDEDLFVKTHAHLVRHGYWLSNLNVCGAVRMRRQTLASGAARQAGLTEERVNANQRVAPGWCEARYLRTVEWLTDHGAGPDRYLLLWVFSMLDGQYGFALDIAAEYRRRFGETSANTVLERLPMRPLKMTRSETRIRRALWKLGRWSGRLRWRSAT